MQVSHALAVFVKRSRFDIHGNNSHFNHLNNCKRQYNTLNNKDAPRSHKKEISLQIVINKFDITPTFIVKFFHFIQIHLKLYH